MEWIGIEQIELLLGKAFSSEVAKFGIAFSIAAWFHSRQVRKEIKIQVKEVTAAWNNLAEALRQDLSNLNSRVSALEKTK